YPIAAINRRLIPGGLSAEIGMPGAISGAGCGREHLTALIGAFQSIEIAAFATALAGNEERHGWLRSALRGGRLLGNHGTRTQYEQNSGAKIMQWPDREQAHDTCSV